LLASAVAWSEAPTVQLLEEKLALPTLLKTTPEPLVKPTDETADIFSVKVGPFPFARSIVVNV